MALFKKWGKKSKSKDISGGFVDGDEETANLPPFERGGGRRDQRNLSISRSGRHKYKNKHRATVDEVFAEGGAHAPEGPPHHQAQQPQPHTQGQGQGSNNYARRDAPSRAAVTVVNKSPAAQKHVAPSSSNYHCREPDSSAKTLSGSQRMASPPTAV